MATSEQEEEIKFLFSPREDMWMKVGSVFPLNEKDQKQYMPEGILCSFVLHLCLFSVYGILCIVGVSVNAMKYSLSVAIRCGRVTEKNPF